MIRGSLLDHSWTIFDHFAHCTFNSVPMVLWTCASLEAKLLEQVNLHFWIIYYTIIVPMPRISACIPWHRHGYRPEGGIRAYATGYRQISVALGTILISVASGPEDIGRYPWHMPRDRCAQPFPFPHCILEPCTTQQFTTPTILESFVDRRPSWSTTQCALYRCENVMPICLKGTLFPTLSPK